MNKRRFGIEFGPGEGSSKDIESNEIEERRYYVPSRCSISHTCLLRALPRPLSVGPCKCICSKYRSPLITPQLLGLG